MILSNTGTLRCGLGYATVNFQVLTDPKRGFPMPPVNLKHGSLNVQYLFLILVGRDLTVKGIKGN